jgi:CRISPR-associated protein Csb1
MTSQFDTWLADDGPVALIINEPLEPATGKHAVVFPPTFAAPEGSDQPPDYVIDEKTGTCLMDTAGSQANRLEPTFKRADLAELTPKFTVKAGTRTVDLLDAGHRAADAIVRFSTEWSRLREAFLAYREQGNAKPLAQIAPTSLVFGVWDSRDTGAKVPRLVESTIRAYGVSKLERSAQYFSSVIGSRGVLQDGDDELKAIDDIPQKTRSEVGLSDSPAGRGPGGIIATEGIRREAVLNLVALRAIGAASDLDATKKLQRYILGLALVAFAAPAQLYLRQGCLLVGDAEHPAATQIVWRTGRRESCQLDEQMVIAFAKAAAKEFVVGKSITATFDPKLVQDKKARTDEKKRTKAAAKG